MTGPEMMAAMKAEDVDAALVEKAARAVWNSDPAVIDGDVQDWDAPDIDFGDINEAVRDEERQTMRHALAAVLPEIQAQALRDAADVALLDRWSGWKWVAEAVSAWLRARAARLATTTEGPK